MKIELDYHDTPQVWRALDADTMDGAEDSGPLARMRGEGTSREAALVDLLDKLDEHYRGELDAQSSLLSKGTCPTGWKLVPAEATDAMCLASFGGESLTPVGLEFHRQMWRDAIAAAPEAP